LPTGNYYETAGTPSYNSQAWSSQSTAVNVQSMGNSSTSVMSIALGLGAGGDTNSGDSTVYNVYINSQGLQNRQMSPQYTPPTTGNNLMSYISGLWNVMVTIDAFSSGDPIAITAALIGDYQSIQGANNQGAAGQAGNNNTAYTVAYGPLTVYADNCTVTQGGTNIIFSQDMVSADNNALLYAPNATMTTTNLNIFLRNQLILLDFRQPVHINGQNTGFSTADTLYVAILNEAVQASAAAAALSQAYATGQVDIAGMNRTATPWQISERRQLAGKIYSALGRLNKIDPALAASFAEKFSLKALAEFEKLPAGQKQAALRQMLDNGEQILKSAARNAPDLADIKLL
ncbi:MAG: hypothetical protein N3A57_05840, partial [Negativicutes bacterium]|nr:hypothetical protein [Negativicutes bacterium]